MSTRPTASLLKRIKKTVLVAIFAHVTLCPCEAREVPQPFRILILSYAALAQGDSVERGGLQQTRIEHYDVQGRLIRWEVRGPKGQHRVSWVGLYFGDEKRPRRAAYWSGENELPFSELVVTSPDGRVSDVLYADFGEKPRRQLRNYLDAAGREIYQEYFSPTSQKKYSEEIYQYDDDGNEIRRLWQRLDRRERRDRRFEITERDPHGAWLERVVRIDGELSYVDVRQISYSELKMPLPPPPAGQIESSPMILPIPFAPGVVSSPNAGENMPSFTPDGRQVLFSRYTSDWKSQQAMTALWRDGAWREPQTVPFAETLYHASFRSDGRWIIYCQRDDDLGGGRVFIVARENQGWSAPVDLTSSNGFTGSYFRWLQNGTLYFHREGNLFRGRVHDKQVVDLEALSGPINTESGTEFSPWVNEEETILLFTRAVEGDSGKSGVFLSSMTEKGWGKPRKLPIPYGWGAQISPDGEDLTYVIDEDIFRIPLAILDLSEDLNRGREVP